MSDIQRKDWISILSKTETIDLKNCIENINYTKDYKIIYGPNVGSIMIRARLGGNGDPYNLGEATLTKCVIKLEEGTTGYSYHLGRDKIRAEYAAVLDALMQDNNYYSKLQSMILDLKDKINKKENHIINESNSSKVDFFTLVRGDG